MAREHPKTADRHQHSETGRSEPNRDRRQNGDDNHQSRNWYGGERENEFGGEGRFRAEGGHGSHFGGDPEALGDGLPDRTGGQDANTSAWHDDRRRKFIEKFERWRSERAAHAAHRGPDSAPTESARPASGRNAKK